MSVSGMQMDLQPVSCDPVSPSGCNPPFARVSGLACVCPTKLRKVRRKRKKERR